jgi:hypothetical protein
VEVNNVWRVSQPALPTDRELIGQACSAAAVPTRGARLLRRHANAVFLLPAAGLVLRLGAPGERSLAKARRGVAITRWLIGHGFPAVEPADVDQPVMLDAGVATYEPLQSFTAILAAARGLPDEDLDFLADTRQRLLTAYADLTFALPAGVIHADAAVAPDGAPTRLRARWPTFGQPPAPFAAPPSVSAPPAHTGVSRCVRRRPSASPCSPSARS